MNLKAKVNCCEEASPASGEHYIPCNAPATRLIGWPERKEGPYRMCEMCADHSIRNRGATDQGPFTPDLQVTPAASAAGIPDFIADAVAKAPKPQPTANDLAALRAKAAKVRDDLLTLSDLEASVDALKARINAAKTKELPDAMEELGISRLDLPPEGNLPGYSMQSKPFYRASIAASWPIEQKAKAYGYLDSKGAGDLLGTFVTIAFSKGQKDDARKALAILRDAGFTPEVAQSIPHTTLTAWLKEQVETHKTLPDLTIIGGQVGRVVDLKPIKEK